MADKCAHRHAPLSEGKLVGDNIQCPYHGLEYNAAGDCVRVPGQSQIPPGCRVQSYPVVERYQWVWIWMGDPALADPDDIEDFHWMDDPDWRAKGERMHLKADYKLLVENLLTCRIRRMCTPLPSVRARSPRTDEFRTGRSFCHTDTMDTDPPASTWFSAARRFELDENVDRWQHVTWTPPAFVKLDVGAARANTGAVDGDRSQGFGYRNLNAITPETDKTAHYFWAQARNFRVDEDWILICSLTHA